MLLNILTIAYSALRRASELIPDIAPFLLVATRLHAFHLRGLLLVCVLRVSFLKNEDLFILFTSSVGGRSQLKAVVTAFVASFTHIFSHMRVIALGVTAFSFLVFFQSCFRREKFE